MLTTRRFIPLVIIAIGLTLSGCDDFPKDPAETTVQIRDSGEMRTGLIAGRDQNNAGEKALAESIAKSVDAAPSFEEGPAEILVPKLEKGELDIVIGSFAKATPWKKHAALSKPVGGAAEDSEKPQLRALVRKGENRWLMQVQRQVKAVPAQTQGDGSQPHVSETGE
ncbi:hypothetical protein A7A08_02983 [Methyloligella halotolerans]|uniref:Uncharacterized protein n=1 Tax=Methyloligella halotolerans TaxID=1177755 RepID=A0A1E2RVI5_9HYPH|nr:hypothetical protein [Methyloligella halotolerans]ODA66130.1 hypothetical protein A7A08_02983 [Methyloligella halotolerans]